ncbi:MAG: hypothetical protein ACT4QG_02990 [Sporichthyaceae bacterium]
MTARRIPPMTRGNAVPGPPPPPETWATRAELLRARADALPRLHQADLSTRTVAGTAALALLASACFLLTTGGWGTDSQTGERSESTGIALAIALVTGIPGAVFTWFALRRTLRSARIGRYRRAWEDLPDAPQARALPPGDLAHDLRDLFDARTRQEGYRVVVQAEDFYGHAWETRLLVRGWLSGMVLMMGGVGLAAPFVGDPGIAGGGIGGAVLFTAGAIQARKGVARSHRAMKQREREWTELKAWRETTGFHGDLRPEAR